MTLTVSWPEPDGDPRVTHNLTISQSQPLVESHSGSGQQSLLSHIWGHFDLGAGFGSFRGASALSTTATNKSEERVMMAICELKSIVTFAAAFPQRNARSLKNELWVITFKGLITLNCSKIHPNMRGHKPMNLVVVSVMWLTSQDCQLKGKIALFIFQFYKGFSNKFGLVICPLINR